MIITLQDADGGTVYEQEWPAPSPIVPKAYLFEGAVFTAFRVIQPNKQIIYRKQDVYSMPPNSQVIPVLGGD